MGRFRFASRCSGPRREKVFRFVSRLYSLFYIILVYCVFSSLTLCYAILDRTSGAGPETTPAHTTDAEGCLARRPVFSYLILSYLILSLLILCYDIFSYLSLCLGAVLGHSRGPWGASWGPLGALLGRSWALLGPSWGPLGALLGLSWGPLGVVLGALEGLLRPPWRLSIK